MTLLPISNSRLPANDVGFVMYLKGVPPADISRQQLDKRSCKRHCDNWVDLAGIDILYVRARVLHVACSNVHFDSHHATQTTTTSLVKNVRWADTGWSIHRGRPAYTSLRPLCEIVASHCQNWRDKLLWPPAIHNHSLRLSISARQVLPMEVLRN